MQPTPRASPTRRYRFATGIVAILTLYHGLIPLLVRPLFGADQRFAPALWLPAPWWWIACLAIVVVGLVLLVIIDEAKQRRAPPPLPDADRSPEPDPADATTSDGRGAYDTLSGLVFLVGLYNGVAPLIARLVFDANLLLALPLRLPPPWWWLTSLAVIAATAAALAALDRAKQRRFPEVGRSPQDHS